MKSALQEVRRSLPSKKERQDSFRARCLADGFSGQKAVERASFFPIVSPDRVRIGKVPKF